MEVSPAPVSMEHIQAVRRFNRLYTQKIGVLREGLLDSEFSLTEVRVLYEIVHRDQLKAADICRDLGLDAGYVSRIIRRLQTRGLIDRRPSDTDKRQSLLSLTQAGRSAFAKLDARSNEDTSVLLGVLTPSARTRLVQAMQAIEETFGMGPERSEPYVLRPPQPGDLGWIVHRHGVLYAQEYGWGEPFEALVAEIAANFLRDHDAKLERCWIAERNGAIVGSVLLVKQSKTVAKLRLLLVEPEARGLGIGNRLVAECVRFARQAGYKKIVLWTNSVLHAARHIYERTGFRLVHEEPHDGFRPGLTAQTWELAL